LIVFFRTYLQSLLSIVDGGVLGSEELTLKVLNEVIRGHTLGSRVEEGESELLDVLAVHSVLVECLEELRRLLFLVELVDTFPHVPLLSLLQLSVRM